MTALPKTISKLLNSRACHGNVVVITSRIEHIIPGVLAHALISDNVWFAVRTFYSSRLVNCERVVKNKHNTCIFDRKENNMQKHSRA